MAFATLQPIWTCAEKAFKDAYATLEDPNDKTHEHLRQ